MSPHKKVYFDYFKLDGSEWVGCEVCNHTAVDVHAIESDGMGGRPSKSTHVIENLMALCRECHIKYGDKKQYVSLLLSAHQTKLNEIRTIHHNRGEKG